MNRTVAGPCAFCGHPDARHRVVDAIDSRIAAGEPAPDVLADYGWDDAKLATVREECARALYWQKVKGKP